MRTVLLLQATGRSPVPLLPQKSPVEKAHLLRKTCPGMSSDSLSSPRPCVPPEKRQAEGATGPRQQHWGGLGLSVLNGQQGTGPCPGFGGGCDCRGLSQFPHTVGRWETDAWPGRAAGGRLPPRMPRAGYRGARFGARRGPVGRLLPSSAGAAVTEHRSGGLSGRR